jgi:CubicO group peptidase (beta-lactamase class C family)
MMWSKTAALAGFALSGVLVTATAQPSGGNLSRVLPETVGVSSQRLELVSEMLRQHVDDGRVAGLVAGMLHEGKLVYLESMGWQVLSESPMRDDSLFQIRSMSKPMTAVAALQLIERGELGLDDPVAKYIPSFDSVRVFSDPVAQDFAATRAPSRAITVADLLKNTAGLSHRFSALYRENGVRSRGDTLAELSDKVAAVPLIGDPGEQWVYSISLTVLGRVVEVVSGMAFDEYLAQEMFAPLGLADTGFFVPPESQSRLARAYAVGSEGLQLVPPMVIPITDDPPLKEGAAGIVSSAPDYLRFLQMLLNGGELEGARVLQGETVAAMTRNQIEPRLMPFGTNPAQPMLDRGWGYGVAVVVDAEKSAYATHNGEFGWSGSLGTFAWADPVTNTALVLMLQVQPAGAHALAQKFKALAAQAIIEK